MVPDHLIRKLTDTTRHLSPNQVRIIMFSRHFWLEDQQTWRHGIEDPKTFGIPEKSNIDSPKTFCSGIWYKTRIKIWEPRISPVHEEMLKWATFQWLILVALAFSLTKSGTFFVLTFQFLVNIALKRKNTWQKLPREAIYLHDIIL